MKIASRINRQRGEVASFLTIVSMVVLSFGILLGYQLNRNAAPINPAPQAAAPAPSKPIPADGVDRHDEVCFPGGDKNQQVRDKYCRTRMYPNRIMRDVIEKADVRAKQVFESIFKSTTDQSVRNPHLLSITSDDKRTLMIYGGLCLNRSSLSGSERLSTDDVEVYISLFGVRKYYDDKGAVGIVSNDKNDALKYKIAAAEDKAGSNNTDELFVAKARVGVCTFTNGRVDVTDYKNVDNPLLFNIQTTKASIESAIARAEKDPTLNQKFDKKACEVYIHLRDNITVGTNNKPKDTYNIFKIDLREYLGDEAATICDPSTTPTPTISESPTPTSPTVTISTSPTPTDEERRLASPTPQTAQCFEKCIPTTQCGADPLTGKAMSCFNATNLNVLPPILPTGGQVDNNIDNPSNSLKLCQKGDLNCLCLPQRCQFNPESCTNKSDACEKNDVPTPLITKIPNETPTVPTSTPPISACVFDALAYVQECASIDPKTGQCKKDSTGRFIAKPIEKGVLTTSWGASNNKQIAGGRYGSNPATPFSFIQNSQVPGAFDNIIRRFPYYKDASLASLTYLDYHAEFPMPAGRNPLEVGSPADFTPEGRSKNPILIAPINQYPDEQYFNREDAQVRLYADFANKGYRVVPDGNRIDYCNNIHDLTGVYGLDCNEIEFEANRVNPNVDPATRDPRDTIAGLTVGCGQSIVYGWTLQKCNPEPADYLFVIDVSTSMSTGKDLSGEVKLDAAKKSLLSFIDTVQKYSKDSRAALIQFSSPDNTRTVKGFTPDLESVKAAVNSNLTVKQGTCIEHGMQETISLIQSNASSNRKTYVIFLTDGLPNCPDGTPSQESIARIGVHGTTLRGMANVTTYSIGYGDPNKEGVGADVELFNVIKLIAKSENHAFSTSRDVAIGDIYKTIETELNACARSEAAFANYITSQDINGDGVINTIDLFLIYDNYFARGQNLPEDLNGDQIVNSLDVSIIVNNMGKVVPQENNTAQKSIGDVFN